MAHKFTEKYIDQCFYAWYENNRPGMQKLQEVIINEDDHKPSLTTLGAWHTDLGWEQRADALDGETSVVLDQEVIQRRVKMYEKLESVGEMMIDKGKTYLETEGITSDNAAIRAITDGAELLQKSVGAAEAYFKISQMTPSQLENAFRNLLSKGKDEFSLEDTVDVIPTDVDSPSNDGENPSEDEEPI